MPIYAEGDLVRIVSQPPNGPFGGSLVGSVGVVTGLPANDHVEIQTLDLLGRVEAGGTSHTEHLTAEQGPEWVRARLAYYEWMSNHEKSMGIETGYFWRMLQMFTDSPEQELTRIELLFADDT